MRPSRLTIAMALTGISLGSLILPSVPSLAQTTTISIDDALRIARDNGITSVTKLELEDNEWETEGRNAAGQRVEIDIDAVNGRILRTETR